VIKKKEILKQRKNFVKMKLTKIKEVLRLKKNYLGGQYKAYIQNI